MTIPEVKLKAPTTEGVPKSAVSPLESGVMIGATAPVEVGVVADMPVLVAVLLLVEERLLVFVALGASVVVEVAAVLVAGARLWSCTLWSRSTGRRGRTRAGSAEGSLGWKRKCGSDGELGDGAATEADSARGMERVERAMAKMRTRMREMECGRGGLEESKDPTLVKTECDMIAAQIIPRCN
jgi:hypothetical protein